MNIDPAISKLLTWKPGPCANIAIRIVEQSIKEDDRIFFADEVPLDFVSWQETNAIGMCWRKLIQAGILKRLNVNRRSKKEGSRGRLVFKYRVADEELAKAFLELNKWTGKVEPNGEGLLFDHAELNGGDHARS